MFIVFYTVTTAYTCVFMTSNTPYCLCNTLTDPWNVCIHAYVYMYVVGSKSFRPDIQKPRQMENAVRDI